MKPTSFASVSIATIDESARCIISSVAKGLASSLERTRSCAIGVFKLVKASTMWRRSAFREQFLGLQNTNC